MEGQAEGIGGTNHTTCMYSSKIESHTSVRYAFGSLLKAGWGVFDEPHHKVILSHKW